MRCFVLLDLQAPPSWNNLNPPYISGTGDGVFSRFQHRDHENHLLPGIKIPPGISPWWCNKSDSFVVRQTGIAPSLLGCTFLPFGRGVSLVQRARSNFCLTISFSGIFCPTDFLMIEIIHDHRMSLRDPAIRHFIIHKGTIILLSHFREFISRTGENGRKSAAHIDESIWVFSFACQGFATKCITNLIPMLYFGLLSW